MQQPTSGYVPFEQLLAYCEGSLEEAKVAQIRALAAQDPLIQETIVQLQLLLQEERSQNIRYMLDQSLQKFLQQPLVVQAPVHRTTSWIRQMTQYLTSRWPRQGVLWRQGLILGNIVLVLILGNMFYQSLVFPAEAQETELTANDPTLLFPDGFTPNGDGLNDVFRPKMMKKVKLFREFSIYNRWGDRVYTATNFSSKSKKLQWDGLFQGEPAEEGPYVYIVRLQNALGFEESFNGIVSLKR